MHASVFSKTIVQSRLRYVSKQHIFSSLLFSHLLFEFCSCSLLAQRPKISFKEKLRSLYNSTTLGLEFLSPNFIWLKLRHLV